MTTPDNINDGAAIIAEVKSGSTMVSAYVREWRPWERWCLRQGIDPTNASSEAVIRYMTEQPRTRKNLYSFTAALTVVYERLGLPSPGKDENVLAARNQLALASKRHKPTDELRAAGKRKHDNQLRQFSIWCKAKGVCEMPADGEDIATFLREISSHYSAGMVQSASAAIARRHRDNGYDNTADYPEVRAAIKEIKAGYQPGVQYRRKVEMAPATTRRRQIHANNWNTWCEAHGIDSKQAATEDFDRYIGSIEGQYRDSYLLERITTIAALYQDRGGNNPTTGEYAQAMAASMRKRIAAEIRERARNGSTRSREIAETGSHPHRVDRPIKPEWLEIEQGSWLSLPLPKGLTPEDMTRVQENRRHWVSNNTLFDYMKYGWEPFVGWCEEIGITPQESHPAHVEAYITAIAENFSADHVDKRLTGIRYVFKQTRPQDNPADDQQVYAAMNSIKRRKPRAHSQADPIREVEFILIARVAQKPQTWEKPQDAILRGATDIAMIGLMRDGLLRVGEAAAARWEHLARKTDGSGILFIPTSKNDQYGDGHPAFVSPNTMQALNAMVNIKQKLGIDIQTDTRIFQMLGHSMSRRIKKACAYAGLEGRYSGHSCRIGMAQDLAASGTSLLRLMLEGRWQNPDMPAHYTRRLATTSGAVADWYDRDPERGKVRRKPNDAYGFVPQAGSYRMGA